ncbi:hypothetical protein [Anatilimnocola floriformis]|uniref:hypothetical protein n=1 Tax=Anatilimnocola floriformis TaxID=2948575 RepID=UPI0020C4D713|nr:hypothetical protein [Anatilimnocola floriformis]
MKRTLIPAVLALVSFGAATTQAGWHHHHQQAVYAYPAYYMPAAVPTQVIIAGISGETPRSNTGDLSTLKADIAEVKDSLKHLDARIENINSTVQAHGEAFGAIMAELKDMKKPSASTKKTLDELRKNLDDDINLRNTLDAMFQGNDADRIKSRDAAINVIYQLLNK